MKINIEAIMDAVNKARSIDKFQLHIRELAYEKLTSEMIGEKLHLKIKHKN